MVKINFDDVPESQDWGPIPEGKYLCMVNSVEEKFTNNGDGMWVIELKIVEEGRQNGKTVRDRIVFSERALPRARDFMEALGLDVRGEVEIDPDDIMDKVVVVDIIQEKYFSEKFMEERTGNKVPYRGYSKAKGSGKKVHIPEPDSDDDIPF